MTCLFYCKLRRCACKISKLILEKLELEYIYTVKCFRLQQRKLYATRFTPGRLKFENIGIFSITIDAVCKSLSLSHNMLEFESIHVVLRM